MRYEFSWPPKSLSPNARVHWRTLAKAKRDYRDACGWTIRTGFALVPLGPGATHARRDMARLKPPVTAQVTFVVADKRRRDTDNYLAMLKPCFDALVEMGVLEDDSADKLKIAEPKWERGLEKKVVVELTGGSDA